MSVHFSLANFNEEIIIPDQKPILPDPPKARTPNLRSRSGKKRKTQDPAEVSNLPQEIVKAVEVITTSYREKSELVQDLQEANDKQAADLARERSEIVRLKKEVRELKANLEKKEVEVANRIKEDREIFKTDIKNEARAVVFEARIKMASDAAAKGFDISLWPVDSWKKNLAFLKQVNPDAGASLDEGNGKIPKPSPKKASPQTTKDAPAPSEEKVLANDPVYEGLGQIESLAHAAEMMDATPGDEGQ